MKKIEIKEIGIKNAFKITVYLTCVPLAIMAFIGVIIAIIGAVNGNGTMLAIGIPYTVMPFVMIGVYGLLSMLVALIYNKLSNKYGGLELVINIKNDKTNEDLTSISHE
jgi:urea transporter